MVDAQLVDADDVSLCGAEVHRNEAVLLGLNPLNIRTADGRLDGATEPLADPFPIAGDLARYGSDMYRP